MIWTTCRGIGWCLLLIKRQLKIPSLEKVTPRNGLPPVLEAGPLECPEQAEPAVNVNHDAAPEPENEQPHLGFNLSNGGSLSHNRSPNSASGKPNLRLFERRHGAGTDYAGVSTPEPSDPFHLPNFRSKTPRRKAAPRAPRSVSVEHLDVEKELVDKKHRLVRI